MQAISTIQTVDEVISRVAASLKGTEVFVIGICGMAGSGKTTICNKILETCPFNAVRLDCDQFSSHSYAERKELIEDAVAAGVRQRIEFEENPKNWYSYQDIISALHSLKSNRIHTFDRAWNKQTGELDAHYQLALPGNGPSMILCDSIYLLHHPIRSELDLVILVDTPEEVITERGLQRSKGDTTRAAYMERLRRLYSVPYFAALRHHADLVYKT